MVVVTFRMEVLGEGATSSDQRESAIEPPTDDAKLSSPAYGSCCAVRTRDLLLAIAALFFNTSALGTEVVVRICVGTATACLAFRVAEGLAAVPAVEEVAFGEGDASSDQRESAVAKEPPVEVAKLSSPP